MSSEVLKLLDTLLDTVGHETVYEFLGKTGDAAVADLREAAAKKHRSIHLQSSRNRIHEDSMRLAVICKDEIFKDEQSKKAYDKSLKRRDTKAKIAQSRTAAKDAVVKGIIRHAERISAAGIIFILLGALAAGFGARAGESILMLGITVFSGGSTAFLYRGSLQLVKVSVAVGLGLVVLAAIAEQITGRPLAAFRLLSGMVLLSGSFSFLLRKSWHVKIIELARPITGRWMAITAAWNPFVRWGLTGILIALVMLVPTSLVAFLFGEAAAEMVATALARLMFGSIVLVVVGLAWIWFSRSGHILQCQSCGAMMSRARWNNLRQGLNWICPQCGTNMPPVRVSNS